MVALLFQFFSGKRETGKALKRRAPKIPPLALLLASTILLAAWGIGPPEGFLTEEHAVKRGVDLLCELWLEPLQSLRRLRRTASGQNYLYRD